MERRNYIYIHVYHKVIYVQVLLTQFCMAKFIAHKILFVLFNMVQSCHKNLTI